MGLADNYTDSIDVALSWSTTGCVYLVAHLQLIGVLKLDVASSCDHL